MTSIKDGDIITTEHVQGDKQLYDYVFNQRRYRFGDRIGLACYCNSDFYGYRRANEVGGGFPPIPITDAIGTYCSWCGGDV